MVVNELRVKQGQAEAEDGADPRSPAGSVLRDGFLLAGSSQWGAPVSTGDLCLPERCMEGGQGAGPAPLHILRPLQPLHGGGCAGYTHNTHTPASSASWSVCTAAQVIGGLAREAAPPLLSSGTPRQRRTAGR